MNQIFYYIIAGAIGFLFNVLLLHIKTKRSKLVHNFDAAAEFSAFPPKTVFQNLNIKNTGNISSKDICVFLRSDRIKEIEAEYKPLTEEQVDIEKRDNYDILKINKLLPKEVLTISFKSKDILPDDLLVKIKSSETISKLTEDINTESTVTSNLFRIVLIILGLVLGFYGPKYLIEFIAPSNLDQKSEIRVVDGGINLSRDVVKSGDTLNIEISVKNISNKILVDFRGSLRIPGFDLSLEKSRHQVRFLQPMASEDFRLSLYIDNDVPNGEYLVEYFVQVISSSNKVYQTYNKSFTVEN